MSNFDKLVVKFSFGCGYIHNRSDEEPLSNFIDEDIWNSFTEQEKDRFLDDLWCNWKVNFETGGAYLEEEE